MICSTCPMWTAKRRGLAGTLLVFLWTASCVSTRNAGDTGPFQGDGEWVRVALRARPWRGEIEPVVEIYKKMGFQAVVVQERHHTAAVSTFHRPPEFVLLPVVTLDLAWGELAGVGVMRELPKDPMKALEVIQVWKGVSLLTVFDWSKVSESLLSEVDVVETLEGGWRGVPGQGDRPGRPWMAVSDSFENGSRGSLGGAWIEVWAKTNEAQSIIDAIRWGSFYATTGPRFARIERLKRRVTAELVDDGTVRVIGPGGAKLAEETDGSVSFNVDSKYNWVRLEAEDSDGQRAWTQPIFL